MRTRTARGAAVAALALAATTALAGCAQLDRWTGTSAGAPPAAPASSASGSPSASASASPSASGTPSPSSTPTPSATPTATPTTTPTPEPPKPPASLRYGDKGKDVLAVQQRLSELGYWLGTPDGSFGSLTQQAVFALQKSAGISRDGVVGPKTRAALDRGARPSAKLSGSGIEIDLDRQVLMVVRGGKPTVILNTSTGSGETYTSSAGHQAVATTPRGTFAVFRQVDGPDDSELGELWRPKYFYRGWAVHGSPNIPPYPASHGCARLSNGAMNMIWAKDLMPIGARVLVR